MTAQQQIAHFADIPVPVEAELAREILSLRRMLQLGQGSVIRLERSAGENVDILIGGALVAFGEIVILEENVGVRITDFNEED
jgi:flagellar motor switch protein FliN/FliY